MRYLPLTHKDREAMRQTIGVSSTEDLFDSIPKEAQIKTSFNLPPLMSEIEVERELTYLASQNLDASSNPFFVGAGLYNHHVPASVDHLIQRGEFLTSYTPYQPEICQGTLQYLFEFQTQVAHLTGMEIANASMYDGATSCVEAVLMANRVTKRNKVVLSSLIHPHYRDVVQTYAKFINFEISAHESQQEDLESLKSQIDDGVSCVVVQNPNFFGDIKDFTELSEYCHEKGALLIVVVTEVVSLGAIKSPGEMGADIVAAEGQSFGNPMNFGGPTVGLFATKEKFMRQIPGRIVGETVDKNNAKGWVLTLSTREQHIRREKATSNICTNAGLCALAFTIHVALLGEKGVRELAQLNHKKACYLAQRLEEIPGVSIKNVNFFNEFVVDFDQMSGTDVVRKLAERNILAGVALSKFYHQKEFENSLLMAATEMVQDSDIETLIQGLSEIL